MKTLVIGASLALSLSMIGFSAGAAAPNCKDEKLYPLIERPELNKFVEKKNATIVDVNTSESFNENHIPGAIHYKSHEKDFASQLPAQKDAPIVAYCGGPMCTAWKEAAEKACQLGYTNIRHFKPGITGWVKGS